MKHLSIKFEIKVVFLRICFCDNKNMDIANDFWKRVNAKIKAASTKQRTVAEQCNLSYQTFRGWVTRQVFPDAYQAYKIAAHLNTTVEYFLTGIESKSPIQNNGITDNGDDEKKLLQIFRSLSEKSKETLISNAQFLQMQDENNFEEKNATG